MKNIKPIQINMQNHRKTVLKYVHKKLFFNEKLIKWGNTKTLLERKLFIFNFNRNLTHTFAWHMLIKEMVIIIVVVLKELDLLSKISWNKMY